MRRKCIYNRQHTAWENCRKGIGANWLIRLIDRYVEIYDLLYFIA